MGYAEVEFDRTLQEVPEQRVPPGTLTPSLNTTYILKYRRHYLISTTAWYL